MIDKFNGPYKVLEWGNKMWKIQVGKRVDVISRDCLKPHLDTGQCGPQGSRAAQAREAEDSLCGFCGFCLWGSEASGTCVAEPGLKSLGKLV